MNINTHTDPQMFKKIIILDIYKMNIEVNISYICECIYTHVYVCAYAYTHTHIYNLFIFPELLENDFLT